MLRWVLPNARSPAPGDGSVTTSAIHATGGTLPHSPPDPPSAPDRAVGPELERVARLAARVLDTPAAMVTLINGHGEIVAAGAGLRDGLTVGAALPLTRALPREKGEPGPLSVRDSRRGGGRRASALARSGVVACLAQPLRDAAGTLRGALAAVDFLPRAWVKDEERVLHELAAFACHEMERMDAQEEARQAGDALHVARDALTGADALRGIAEQPLVGLFMLEGGRIRWANPEFARMLGYTLEEMTAADAPGELRFEGEDRERLLHAARTLRPGDGSVHVCTPMRRSDGSWARVELHLGRIVMGDHQVVVGAGQDVSLASVEDDSLRAELARYRRVFDDDLCGTVVASPDCRIVACNAEFARLAGFPSPEAAVGVELDRLEAEPGELAERVETLRRGGAAAGPSELELVRRDGTRVRVVARLAADLDDAGQPRELRGYLVDVTQRAQREQVLLLSDERLRLLELATNDVTWDWDLATGRLLWNAAGPLRLRYTPDEVRTSPEWHFEHVHPDDRERVVAGVHGAISGVAAAWTDEYRFLRGDGTYATVHDRAYVMRNARGEPVRVTGWMVDVTERKRVEETQRFLARAGAVLDAALDVEVTTASLARLCVPVLGDFCMVDLVEPDGGVRRHAVAHARASREKLLAPDAFLPPDADAGASPVAQVARTGEPVLCAECDDAALVALDAALEPGSARRLGTHSYLLVPVTAHETVLAVITLGFAQPDRRYGPMDLLLAKDVAQRGALALENARLYQTAQHALRAREEVLGVVSHDLRNPLQTIVTTAMLLSSVTRERREESRRWLDVIGRAAQQMNSLIGDLLDVSSMEAGRFEVAPAGRNLTALLGECCEQFRPLCQAQQLELRCEIPGELPGLWFDERQLQRVLANLLGNAIKFSRGGGSIRLRAEVAPGEVRVGVSDQGPGIPEEHRARVFDRFWKADNGDRRGAGLGLAIAQGIVEAHGGRIWVESEPGVGSTFWFALPLRGE
jgi:PAS domain S-box-containing protein